MMTYTHVYHEQRIYNLYLREKYMITGSYLLKNLSSGVIVP